MDEKCLDEIMKIVDNNLSVYKRFYSKSEDDDEKNLMFFFLGAQYALLSLKEVVYDEVEWDE